MAKFVHVLYIPKGFGHNEKLNRYFQKYIAIFNEEEYKYLS